MAEKIIFFSSAIENEWSIFSNFSEHSIRSPAGVVFPTAEHAFQWAKFYGVSPTSGAYVLEAKTPKEARRRGKIAKGLHPNWSTGPIMEQRRVKLMKSILKLKTSQNIDVLTALLRSDSMKLVENAPWDNFWGSGKDGKGKNILGVLWMMLRSDLVGVDTP